MNLRMRSIVWAAAVCLALASGQVWVGAQSTLQIELEAPTTATLGEEIDIAVTLKDADGALISGAPISFFSPANFVGVVGEIEIGVVSTGTDGVAELRYTPRRAGEVTFTARFEGAASDSSISSTRTISVTGAAQLYRQSAGVNFPFLGAWTVALVLAVVWGLLLLVVYFITRIAQDQVASAIVEGRHD